MTGKKAPAEKSEDGESKASPSRSKSLGKTQGEKAQTATRMDMMERRLQEVESASQHIQEDQGRIGKRVSDLERRLQEVLGSSHAQPLVRPSLENNEPSAIPVGKLINGNDDLEGAIKLADDENRINCGRENDGPDAMYHIEGSMYSLPLLTWSSHMTWLASLQSFLLIACAFSIQISFIYVLRSRLVNLALFNSAQIEKWRITTGHNSDFIDPITAHSLSARVCHSDSSLHVSNLQSDLKSRFDKLVGPIGDRSPAGNLLTMLAILGWILNCMCELRASSDFFFALLHIERDAHTHIQRTPSGDYKILTVSLARKLFALSVAIGRTCLAISLMLVGVQWLMCTTSIEDMLLNATALGFIFEIDEYLYVALAPQKGKTVIEHILPLRRPMSIHCFGSDAESIFLILSTILTLIGCQVLHLSYAVNAYELASNTLCADNIDFVYAHGIGRFVAMAETPGYTDSGKTKFGIRANAWGTIIQDNVHAGRLFGTFNPNKINQLAPEDQALFNKTYRIDLEDVHHWKSKPVAEIIADANPECVDWLGVQRPKVPQVYTGLYYQSLEIVRRATNDLGVSNCNALREHVLSLCDWPSCLRPLNLRLLKNTSEDIESTWWIEHAFMLCPYTLGCSDYFSELPLSGSKFGCPQSCAFSSAGGGSKVLVDELEALDLPCSDKSTEELQNSLYWSKWADAAAELLPDHIVVAMKRDGCAAIQNDTQRHFRRLNVCRGTSRADHDPVLKPLFGVCPVACKCNLLLKDNAPDDVDEEDLDIAEHFCPSACYAKGGP